MKTVRKKKAAKPVRFPKWKRPFTKREEALVYGDDGTINLREFARIV